MEARKSTMLACCLALASSFTPNPAGGMEIISTDSTGTREYARLNAAILQKENAWLDDRSLFFILPALLDPKIIGGEARFVLVCAKGGQRATMRLRAEGVAEVTDSSGNKE